MLGMLDLMTNSSAHSGRYRQMLVAFASGCLLAPLSIFATAAVLLPLDAVSYGNASFWTAIVIGSLVAAALAFWAKTLSTWRSAFLGFAVVLFFLFVWLAWLSAAGAA